MDSKTTPHAKIRSVFDKGKATDPPPQGLDQDYKGDRSSATPRVIETPVNRAAADAGDRDWIEFIIHASKRKGKRFPAHRHARELKTDRMNPAHGPKPSIRQKPVGDPNGIERVAAMDCFTSTLKNLAGKSRIRRYGYGQALSRTPWIDFAQSSDIWLPNPNKGG